MATTNERRISLTGPASERAAKRWMDAVYTVPGWKPLHFPLVRIVGQAIPESRVGLLPSFVAVTSQNALPALKHLWDRRTDVRDAPHAAVGIATARAMRALGVDPVIVGPAEDAGAASLAEEILARTENGQTILWPRGDRATDLRERLVVAGRIVQDPIAYRTEDEEDSVVPKNLSAVFFASPSAVKVWLKTPDIPRVTAIAIGQTTYAELAPEYARFSRMVRLAKPTPLALADALAALP
ncbi:uroporphyrinogen-III synthase [Planctomycetes bacterium Poly30]|uniref:Uroporphyrinogen-III synthase n=1 Tax=Saltatorellus ferox TaxID=2528018 RepID=A0A518F0U2_9BACT|nr:uroporphyrinogen-III synthase [Planctomycetes bacterium Poly30]